MITLLIYFLVGVLVILILRWGLGQCGLPANIVNVICVILALILVLWLLSHSGILGSGPRESLRL